MLRKMSLARNATAPAMLAIALCLGACADQGADYQPVVDMRGHTEAAYQRDVAVCRQAALSARNNAHEAEDAGIGAVAGGAGGALLGAVGGAPLLGAGIGALAGAVGTGGYEEVKTENREERIVRNCMRTHGYTILGQVTPPAKA
jgi:outer membrane lipoprotein SlyB